MLAAASCGSNDDDAIAEPPTEPTVSTTTESTTTTTSTSTTSLPPDATHQAIIDRYLGFWDARLEANTGTPDPDDPALDEFSTGAQLDTVRSETRDRRERGIALRAADPSQTSHEVTVISADGERAELQDCFVNDGVVYRVDTGEVLDDSIVTRSVSAMMVVEDGVWKLERATVVQEWEGIGGCALAA